MSPHKTIHTVSYHTILRLQQMQQSNMTETNSAVFLGESSDVASQLGEHSVSTAAFEITLHKYCSSSLYLGELVQCNFLLHANTDKCVARLVDAHMNWGFIQGCFELNVLYVFNVLREIELLLLWPLDDTTHCSSVGHLVWITVIVYRFRTVVDNLTRASTKKVARNKSDV